MYHRFWNLISLYFGISPSPAVAAREIVMHHWILGLPNSGQIINKSIYNLS